MTEQQEAQLRTFLAVEGYTPEEGYTAQEVNTLVNDFRSKPHLLESCLRYWKSRKN